MTFSVRGGCCGGSKIGIPKCSKNTLVKNISKIISSNFEEVLKLKYLENNFKPTKFRWFIWRVFDLFYGSFSFKNNLEKKKIKSYKFGCQTLDKSDNRILFLFFKIYSLKISYLRKFDFFRIPLDPSFFPDFKNKKILFHSYAIIWNKKDDENNIMGFKKLKIDFLGFTHEAPFETKSFSINE